MAVACVLNYSNAVNRHAGKGQKTAVAASVPVMHDQWLGFKGHRRDSAHMHGTLKDIAAESIRSQSGLDGLMKLAFETARSACGFR